MPRKKKVEEPVIEQGGAVTESEIVDVTAVVDEIDEAGETEELIWVETVTPGGKKMIQIPKK